MARIIELIRKPAEAISECDPEIYTSETIMLSNCGVVCSESFHGAFVRFDG